MNWFYAKDGQPAGPVDDEELERLIASGVVRDTTLVWRSGLAEWRPCGEIRPPPMPMPLPSPAAADRTESEPSIPSANRSEDRALGQNVPPSRGTAVGAPYAGFWIRLVAGLFDALILLPVFVTLNLSFVVVFPDFLAWSTAGAHIRTLFNFVSLAIAAVYFTGFVGRFGATPGKWVCDLRVVSAEGGRISYGRALGRFFCMAVFFGADLILAGLNEQKCALHDFLCNTRVTHTD